MVDGLVLEEVNVSKYVGSLLAAKGVERQKYSRELWRGVKYWEPCEAI